jgi:hypothetical protein
MELTYRLTRDDYRQFARLARERMAPSGKRPSRWKGPAGAALLLVLALMALTIFTLEWLTSSGIIDQRANLAAGITYLWGMWTTYLLLMFLRHRASGQTGDGSDESLLKVDDDGLHLFSADRTRTETYSWRAFTDMSEHDDYLVLWLAPRKGVIVPIRMMAGEDMRRAFVDLARARIAPPPPTAPA